MKLPLPARSVSVLLFALILAVPLARVQAGGRHTTPRKPFEPVYNAITSVDATAHTISYSTVNGKGSATGKTFKVTDKTEIEVNGQKGTLNDLKTGMQVSVDPGMDETVAERITAKTAPAEPTPYPTPVRPHR